MDKSDISHVEIANEVQLSGHRGDGQVELLRGDDVVLIPTPSADPRGIPKSAYEAYVQRSPPFKIH